MGCLIKAEFAVPRNMGKVRGKVMPWKFRKANFQLFKDIVNGTTWETALPGTREQNRAGKSLKTPSIEYKEGQEIQQGRQETRMGGNS